ncbi:hypothetical protein SAMN06265375_1011344 [Muriicola jejuensis]|nr:hypothetical protein SAMN06265375_1011344 [Muriicola jejuensis]
MALILVSATTFANTVSSLPSVNGKEKELKEGPYFRKSGDKLFLNFFNKEMGDVQIKVIDSENRVLYSETLKSTLVVEKAFNFGNAEKDSYKVVVRDANDSYAEYYVVK